MMSPEDSWVSKWQRISEWVLSSQFGSWRSLFSSKPFSGAAGVAVRAAKGVSAPNGGTCRGGQGCSPTRAG